MVEGVNYVAPQSFTWTPGSIHSISVSSSQAGATGTRYVFGSWSDGLAQTHNITVPSSATTYTATFTTQYLLTTSVSPSGGGSVGANPTSTDRYYNSGLAVQLTATANTGFQFANWTGDLTGTTNPQSVTMSAPRSVTANFTTGFDLTIAKSHAGVWQQGDTGRTFQINVSNVGTGPTFGTVTVVDTRIMHSDTSILANPGSRSMVMQCSG
jgi:hypothetical protein